jgi:hypothetical protein
VLLSGDFLYMTGSLRDRLVRTFGDKHGISRSDVLLAASHTHFAPNLDKSKPLLGEVDEDYLRFAEEGVETLVGDLLNAPGEPVAVRHHRLVSRHNINRRVLKIDADGTKIIDAAHCDPGGPCDPGLDVLRFDNQGGTLCGVVVRYSCHPVSLPDRLELSAEFPGVIRRKIRDDAGRADLPVLYLQGYAGQLAPEADRFRAGGLASSAEASLEVVPHSAFTRPVWEKWAGSIAADAGAALAAAADAPALAPSLISAERTKPLADVIEDLPSDHSGMGLSVQMITIAADLLLVAISAEPTSAWAEIVCDLLPDRLVIPVGCANQVYGYLPTAREAAQGGYEAEGFLPAFNLAGRFRPGFADTVTMELAALLAPLGENAPMICRDRIAALRRRIDHLLTERDEGRALAMWSRSAQTAAEERLAGVADRAQNLEEAAANLRRLLQQATTRIGE